MLARAVSSLWIVVTATLVLPGAASTQDQSSSPDDVVLRASTGGQVRAVGSASFCAQPNGEPVTLSCGLRVSPPRGTPLRVRDGAVITLHLGAPARRLLVAWERRRGDELHQLRHLAPAAVGSDQQTWTVRALEPRATALLAYVEYAVAVRLRLPGRQSAPFEDASASFLVGLRER